MIAGPTQRETPGRLRQLSDWARRPAIARRFAFALAVLAVLSGIATYAVLTRNSPFGPDPDVVLVLVNVNLVLLLALAVVVVRRVVQLWAERRRGSAGSRLHVRLVLLFSVVAATPAIVVAVFSVVFLNFGLQSWFSDSVRNSIYASLDVAKAYLDEQQNIVRADVMAVAQELGKDSAYIFLDPARLETAVWALASRRGLSDAVVFDRTGVALARASYAASIGFDPLPSGEYVARAERGDVPVITNESGDRMRALVRLAQAPNLYLFAGRFVQPGVLNYVKRVRDAVLGFEQLEARRARLQIYFAMLFAVLSLVLLLAAVWIGLLFATELARPISLLIGATERVRAGDLSVRVEGIESTDEMGTLARAFNRMTGQLGGQQAELIEANRQLDDRRRFTEAVLAGVSAGVVGLDAAGRINLPNRTASTLLETDLERAIGRPFREVAPEMAELLGEAMRRPRVMAQGQVRVVRGRTAITLLVRVTAEHGENEVLGYVATFDDVTELQSAQRMAAWADVARRIAHEIKNPLTPIQLAAERLKRKYLKDITTDPEIFIACTDTIVRQVGDIGRMVDEFSSFARMPAPVMRSENLTELCRQAIFLQRQVSADIAMELDSPPIAERECDARQIGQALTNLLKNATESIAARHAADEGAPKGRIVVRVASAGGRVGSIDIEDNGIGLPVELRDRLTEPYITTRTKGTGLGLAIVRKIMEDHGGALALEDREGGGARLRLIFPNQAVLETQAKAPETTTAHGA